MKSTIIRVISAAMVSGILISGQINAQTSASAQPPVAKHPYEAGPHGGLLCPANDNYKFEMVYRENDKKVDIYFINPDGNLVEAGNLTGEVTFVGADKSVSQVNSSYQNKKFTVGLPDGKPLYMCGIVLTHQGQMYGSKFPNPSMVK